MEMDTYHKIYEYSQYLEPGVERLAFWANVTTDEFKIFEEKLNTLKNQPDELSDWLQDYSHKRGEFVQNDLKSRPAPSFEEAVEGAKNAAKTMSLLTDLDPAYSQSREDDFSRLKKEHDQITKKIMNLEDWKEKVRESLIQEESEEINRKPTEEIHKEPEITAPEEIQKEEPQVRQTVAPENQQAEEKTKSAPEVSITEDTQKENQPSEGKAKEIPDKNKENSPDEKRKIEFMARRMYANAFDGQLRDPAFNTRYTQENISKLLNDEQNKIIKNFISLSFMI